MKKSIPKDVKPEKNEMKEHHKHRTKPAKLHRNRYPIPVYDSMCLVISSLFFLIPGMQAFSCHQVSYGILSVLTSAVSVLYWYYAIPGWRRSLDLYMAKLSFVIYFITGALYVTDRILLLTGWPICLCILWTYWMSGQEWQRDRHYWVYWHMAFHFFVAIEQLVVITGSFDQCSQKRIDFKHLIFFICPYLQSLDVNMATVGNNQTAAMWS